MAGGRDGHLLARCWRPSIDGARGVLLSISGGSDLGLFEINEAAQLVSEAAHRDANIIFGAVIDDALGDEVRVTVIAAGFDGGQPPTHQRQQGSARPSRGDSSSSSRAGATPAPAAERRPAFAARSAAVTRAPGRAAPRRRSRSPTCAPSQARPVAAAGCPP